MTALAVEIARMIYAVPDISPFTRTTREELSTLYPLLRSLKLITPKECNENVMNISNNFSTAKATGEAIRIVYIEPQIESTHEEDAMLLGEFGRLIFQIGFREYSKLCLNAGGLKL